MLDQILLMVEKLDVGDAKKTRLNINSCREFPVS